MVFGLAAGVPWLAQRGIVRAAQARGWRVEAQGGRIGLRGIWFERLALDAGQQATIRATFQAACLRWRSVWGRPSLSLGSGQVELSGGLEELRSLLRGRGEGAGKAAGRGTAAELDLYHLDVTWREAPGAEERSVANGMELHRGSEPLQLSIASLRANYGNLSMELKGARIEPAAPVLVPKLETGASTSTAPPYRITATELVTLYDASIRSEANASDAGLKAPGHAPRPIASSAAGAKSAPPPSKTPKLQAAGQINGGKKELLPVLGWVFDELERLRHEVAVGPSAAGTESKAWLGRVPIGSSFEVTSMRLRVVDSGQKLELGPWPLRSERQEQQFHVDLSQAATGDKTALSAQLTLSDRFEQASLRFSVGPVTLSQLGITDGDFGLENVDATRLGLEATAEFESKSAALAVESKGRLEGLSIHQPFLARETVKGIGFEWQGSATLDSATRRIKSDLIRVSVGPVSARVSGTVELARAHQAIDGVFEVPLAACQDLFDVVPEGLAPLLKGWGVDRNFALRLSVDFDSRHVEKSKIGFRLDNNCRVTKVPPQVAPARFGQPFALEVEDEQGAYQSTSFGPGTLEWTPLSMVSPYVESAVLVCEDGRFLYHHGFDREAIQNSIRENLRVGRFVRGASTVSMQLAKNLYLRRDKTIARKLQEAALTMLLEQAFSKRELLELYLNVIEFGPGIYGIGPAAKHYFDTTPERLTMAQSFFLMSILPNPKQHFFGPDGHLHAGRMKLLRSLMTIAQKRGHFSELELEAGLAEEPEFRVPGTSTSLPNRRMLPSLGSAIDDELDWSIPQGDE